MKCDWCHSEVKFIDPLAFYCPKCDRIYCDRDYLKKVNQQDLEKIFLRLRRENKTQ